MKTIERLVAEKLMAIKAVKLQPNDPFTWASGWHSPIYCDNRKTLAFPDIRTIIKTGLVSAVQRIYGDKVDAIAGVATGAIAQGALVADALGVPFVYVRSAPKDHGMGNLIEGQIQEGWNVVVIEDLISTGGSSLKAVAALRQANVNVLGMVAIFTYQFPQAQQATGLHPAQRHRGPQAVARQSQRVGPLNPAPRLVLPVPRPSRPERAPFVPPCFCQQPSLAAS